MKRNLVYATILTIFVLPIVTLFMLAVLFISQAFADTQQLEVQTNGTHQAVNPQMADGIETLQGGTL